jgi:hypothetical protein
MLACFASALARCAVALANSEHPCPTKSSIMIGACNKLLRATQHAKFRQASCISHFHHGAQDCGEGLQPMLPDMQIHDSWPMVLMQDDESRSGCVGLQSLGSGKVWGRIPSRTYQTAGTIDPIEP